MAESNFKMELASIIAAKQEVIYRNFKDEMMSIVKNGKIFGEHISKTTSREVANLIQRRLKSDQITSAVSLCSRTGEFKITVPLQQFDFLDQLPPNIKSETGNLLDSSRSSSPEAGNLLDSSRSLSPEAGNLLDSSRSLSPEAEE